MSKTAWILTCEHAGNEIPRRWQDRVSIPQRVLDSHRGIDVGAGALAAKLHQTMGWPLITCEVSRLLIELNRSLHHPDLFSPYSNGLSDAEKQKLINTIYLPYREQVDRLINDRITAGQRVVHISVHSFTPKLRGEVRNADIGLLYDPQASLEKSVVMKWKRLLHPHYKTRLNYPYKGVADALTTCLRKRHPQNIYAGIELEVNHRLLKRSVSAVHAIVADTLSALEKEDRS